MISFSWRGLWLSVTRHEEAAGTSGRAPGWPWVPGTRREEGHGGSVELGRVRRTRRTFWAVTLLRAGDTPGVTPSHCSPGDRQAGHWQGLGTFFLEPLWLCPRSRDEINPELERRNSEPGRENTEEQWFQKMNNQWQFANYWCLAPLDPPAVLVFVGRCLESGIPDKRLLFNKALPSASSSFPKSCQGNWFLLAGSVIQRCS